MALKLKKDIKKSSYYVWFLGAKESKGLRGVEYVRPVVENLEEREKDVEPFKVTLQVSHKGLKIVQNVLSQSGKSGKPKNETIKHFIPHNTITCVHQKDDIIACILLLFNPVTKCPLHVHAYRCDSLETATLLKSQLQTLIERPENQKKFAEIEGRLSRPVKESKKFDSSIGSDTGTSTRESESSEERFNGVATLYDSVAAELRAKLIKNDVPILLPPRDYDTVHRQKGNLTGIELRRCLNSNIVGQNVKARRLASSGGSSGIGSDHAPSPESPDVLQDRFHAIDGHSTSDEDWNADNEATLYLMDTAPLRQSRQDHDRVVPEVNPTRSREYDRRKAATRQHLEEHIRKKLAARALEEQKYLDQHQPKPAKRQQERSRMDRYVETPARYSPESPARYSAETLRYSAEPPVPKLRQKYYGESKKQRSTTSRQRSPSPPVSPRDRFKDAKEKFLLLEHEATKERKQYYPEQLEQPISPVHKEKPFVKRHESMTYSHSRYAYDDDFDEQPKPAPRSLHRDEVRYRAAPQKYDPKRRSMFNLAEHKQNSHDIARELKRRSYLEQGYADQFYEHDPGGYSKSTLDLDQQTGRYLKNQKSNARNSYAEPPKYRQESTAKKYEVLHRTNSTVSNGGRVGIASVHPY